MKTIKLIDLLSKIANGEELPKKICYEGYIWTWNGETYDNKEQCLFEDYIDKLYVITDVLNNEVEIIEEEQDIEELGKDITDNACSTKDQRTMAIKINELIKAVNELKKNER